MSGSHLDRGEAKAFIEMLAAPIVGRAR